MNTVKLNVVAPVMLVLWTLALSVPLISNADPLQHSLAGAAFNPQLRHFFPGDRLSAAGGLVDLVSGKTLTPGKPVLSVDHPDYISVAPMFSGPLTLSGPWDLDTAKPFLIMGVFSTQPNTGLSGFWVKAEGGVSSGFEIWLSSFSLSNIAYDDYYGVVTDESYSGGAGYADVAAGLLVVPGKTVTFFYAADNDYWEQHTYSLVGWPALLPFSTRIEPISNNVNGIRKINGLLAYQFDAAPTGLKAAVTTMRESFVKGRNLPYPGW